MGTISSGTGLISGINTQQLIDQLIQIEARPRQIVQERVSQLESQKKAFNQVAGQLDSLGSAAQTLSDEQTFQAKQATSSNTAVLEATAENNAQLGSYNLEVSRLVSSHQLLSRGFADRDTTTFEAGTLRFESARARLDADPRLTGLRGEQGVSRGTIRITDRSGSSAEIDLSEAVRLSDVTEKINRASAISVEASIDGDGLKLTDTSGSTSQDLVVEDVADTGTASDLGLAGNSGGTDTIDGDQINFLSRQSALSRLNDGNGVRTTGSGLDDLQVSLQDGSSFTVDLGGANSVGDAVDAINDASGGDATASIASDGVGLSVTDNTSGTNTFSISAVGSSKAAEDLGLAQSDGDGDGAIQGDRLIAELGSKLLDNTNGGSGVNAGTVRIQARDGSTTDIDLSAASSVSDVIETINNASAGVEASLNNAGNGLLIKDTTGSTANNLAITDQSGSLAADLGLDTGSGGVSADRVNGGDVDLRFISETTALDDLNGGEGVAEGTFTLTDSSGTSATVDLTQDNENTLGDVIDEINSRSTQITASVNAAGDGIKLTDNAGGSLKMRVDEGETTTARDLGINATDDDGDGVIDGSFEQTVDVTSSDTLQDVAGKINDNVRGVGASIINDGSGTNPYRLNITSERSGAAGRILFDDGGLNFDASTLSEGRDAVAFFGGQDPADALMVTSSNNTLRDTVEGVTIDLKSASEQPVELTVERDTGAAVDAVKKTVEAFNNVISTIQERTKFNQETNERGVLLGDNTANQVSRQLFNLVNDRMDGVGGRYEFLSQVGITVGDGSQLQLNEDKLREAINTDPESVRQLFTATTTTSTDDDLPDGVSVPGSTEQKPLGFGARLQALTEDLTNSVDGTLTNKTDSIDTQIEQANERIDRINQQLQAKRERLRQQFLAMERSLAQLQSQQQALSRIGIGGGGGSGGGGLSSLISGSTGSGSGNG